jgi:hypothetical protein
VFAEGITNRVSAYLRLRAPADFVGASAFLLRSFLRHSRRDAFAG